MDPWIYSESPWVLDPSSLKGGMGWYGNVVRGDERGRGRDTVRMRYEGVVSRIYTYTHILDFSTHGNTRVCHLNGFVEDWRWWCVFVVCLLRVSVRSVTTLCTAPVYTHDERVKQFLPTLDHIIIFVSLLTYTSNVSRSISLYLQPQRIILHIHRLRQHRTLIPRRIIRQCQHNLILPFLQ